MAEENGTHSPEEHPTKHAFPEVKGKIVDFVQLTVEADYYGITIRFQDKTALTFALESCIITFPTFEDFSAANRRSSRNTTRSRALSSDSKTRTATLTRQRCRVFS